MNKPTDEQLKLKVASLISNADYTLSGKTCGEVAGQIFDLFEAHRFEAVEEEREKIARALKSGQFDEILGKL